MTYSGVVMHGEKTGAKLGFPTANIPLNNTNISGIYAAKVTVGDGSYDAGVYVNTKRNILEAHLLDFSGDLYDTTIAVTLYKKIREDKDFVAPMNTAELSKMIADDIVSVRKYFEKP